MRGAGVKVGRRVAVSCPMKAATRVGLIVGVERGVGVAGTSIISNSAPGEILT